MTGGKGENAPSCGTRVNMGLPAPAPRPAAITGDSPRGASQHPFQQPPPPRAPLGPPPRKRSLGGRAPPRPRAPQRPPAAARGASPLLTRTPRAPALPALRPAPYLTLWLWVSPGALAFAALPVSRLRRPRWAPRPLPQPGSRRARPRSSSPGSRRLPRPGRDAPRADGYAGTAEGPPSRRRLG